MSTHDRRHVARAGEATGPLNRRDLNASANGDTRSVADGVLIYEPDETSAAWIWADLEAIEWWDTGGWC